MISNTVPHLSSLLICGGFLGALIGANSTLRSKAVRGQLGAAVFSTAVAGMTIGLLVGVTLRVIPLH
jgi:hypothetical protein